MTPENQVPNNTPKGIAISPDFRLIMPKGSGAQMNPIKKPMDIRRPKPDGSALKTDTANSYMGHTKAIYPLLTGKKPMKR